MAEPELEVLRHQERRRGNAGHHQQAGRVGGRERADPQQAHRQHGLAGPPLPGNEARDQDCRQDQRADYLRVAPAYGARPDQAPGERDRADGYHRHAWQVEPGGRPAALRQPRDRKPGSGQADRDVEPEDPVPVQALHHGTTDQRAAGDGQAADGAPDADRGGAPLGRECGGQDGQAQRGNQRGAQALDGPRADQQAGVRRQRACRRRGGEQEQTGDVHAAAAEPVAERRGRDDSRGEGQRVGVDSPLQRRDAAAEAGVDGRQRRYHHERVESCHEEGHRRQRQRPASGLGELHVPPPGTGQQRRLAPADCPSYPSYGCGVPEFDSCGQQISVSPLDLGTGKSQTLAGSVRGSVGSAPVRCALALHL